MRNVIYDKYHDFLKCYHKVDFMFFLKVDPNLCPPLHPKCDHWATIYAKKTLKGGVPKMSGTLIKPTWARPAAQNAQGYVFIDSGMGFGVILGLILKQFGFDFGAI